MSNASPAPPRGPGGPGGHGGPRGMAMVREKPKDVKGTVKRLVRYIGSSRYLFFSLLAIMVFVTLLSLAAPALQGYAIDAITLKEGQLHVDFPRMASILTLLSAVYIASSLLTYLQGLFSAKLSQQTVRVMRGDLFEKIVHLPIRYLDTHPHGDIMSRMTNDVENISNTISQSIGSLFSGVLTLIGSVAIMLYYSPMLTLISFVTVILSALATLVMSKFMRKYFAAQQALLGQLNGQVEEMVTGYKTVVAFSREDTAKREFNETSNRLQDTAIRAQIFGGAMGPLMNVIGNFGFLLIAGFGGWFALTGAITIGTIQAFILYARQFTRPINEIANLYGQIQTALAGAERVFSILDHASERQEAAGTLDVAQVKGDLDFRHIYFGYVPGEPVLKDFNLTVKSGQKVAIVGATGSGKTTLVNLLTRLYDIDSGEILLDGQNIQDIPLSELRRSIAIVLQDTVLFSDTISANIRYGRLDARQDEVEAAAATANADHFIAQLPREYQTQLSESGGNLSQGQRQLLSIARAVLADPKILILDEATSSVDTRTEMHIQQAMVALMAGRTSLIIAHRLSTIRDADNIVVIENGRVAEMGNHDQLLSAKGCYWRLYQNQFAGIAT